MVNHGSFINHGFANCSFTWRLYSLKMYENVTLMNFPNSLLPRSSKSFLKKRAVSILTPAKMLLCQSARPTFFPIPPVPLKRSQILGIFTRKRIKRATKTSPETISDLSSPGTHINHRIFVSQLGLKIIT